MKCTECKHKVGSDPHGGFCESLEANIEYGDRYFDSEFGEYCGFSKRKKTNQNTGDIRAYELEKQSIARTAVSADDYQKRIRELVKRTGI